MTGRIVNLASEYPRRARDLLREILAEKTVYFDSSTVVRGCGGMHFDSLDSLTCDTAAIGSLRQFGKAIETGSYDEYTKAKRAMGLWVERYGERFLAGEEKP